MNTTFEYSPAYTVLIVLVSVAVYVYYGITAGRIFAKAGVKSWHAWVPFLNSWRLLQIGGQHGAWIFSLLVPGAGAIVYLVFYTIAQFHIGKALGRSSAFVLLAIFPSPVWFGILGFGKSTWAARHVTRIPASARETPAPDA